MSPIGRVFIVLNLLLAGGFAMVSGTYLQNQHNYREKYQAEQKAHEADNQKNQELVSRLEQDRNDIDVARTTFQQQLQASQVQVARLQDDNKRLSELTSAQEATLKKAVALQEAANSQARAAFDQAKEAYAASIAAGNEKDAAVREKDAALAENRDLKNEISGLNETVAARDASIQKLSDDNSEQKLLVKTAIQKGFLPAMAAPALAGMVMSASPRLCTIQISENQSDVNIQESINARPFRFAIYDDGGNYKGEAVATKYDESANAVFCDVLFAKGQIRSGDRASTKL